MDFSILTDNVSITIINFRTDTLDGIYEKPLALKLRL